MTELPPDLRKLPAKALDVLRFLGTQPAGADIETIMEGTGLSARGCRKAIRRLVTRYYLEMPEREFYTLSARGREAVEALRAFDSANAPAEKSAPQTAESPAPPSVESPPPVEAAEKPSAPTAEPARPQPQHMRRLSVFLPKALAMGLPAKFQVGFGPPLENSAPLQQTARLVLRLSVPNCEVSPAEHTLEIVNDDGAVGPVGFRVQAQRAQTTHVKLAVYQRGAGETLLPLGGMFFDLAVTEFPTPDSAALQTLAVVVRMYEGEKNAEA